MAPSRFSALVVAALCCMAAGDAKVNSAIVNTKVERSVDASTHIVTETAKISFKSTSGSVSKYHVAVPAARVAHLASFSAKGSSKPLDIERSDVLEDGTQLLVVRLRKALAEGKKKSITVVTTFTHILEPFPREIKQADSQLVRWTDSHVLLSPYVTEEEKTTVRLESTRVESYTPKSPSASKGDRLVFGPYKNTAAFSTSPLAIHAENNSPFLTMERVEREVEVSHWGNVAVEEVYAALHGGAALTGGFSRFDFQMQRTSRGPHFRDLTAQLPAGANGVYYRDIIGNISTSNLRDRASGPLLQLKARFPLFGGWRTAFYIGHNTPSDAFLSVLPDNRMRLAFDAAPYIRDAVTDELQIKVILPEGATDISVHHELGQASQDETRRFTYLDSRVGGGRPVIILRANNVVDAHRKPVIVTYTAAGYGLWLEPAMLIAFFALCFTSVIVVSRIRCSIAPQGMRPKGKAE